MLTAVGFQKKVETCHWVGFEDGDGNIIYKQYHGKNGDKAKADVSD